VNVCAVRVMGVVLSLFRQTFWRRIFCPFIKIKYLSILLELFNVSLHSVCACVTCPWLVPSCMHVLVLQGWSEVSCHLCPNQLQPCGPHRTTDEPHGPSNCQGTHLHESNLFSIRGFSITHNKLRCGWSCKGQLEPCSPLTLNLKWLNIENFKTNYWKRLFTVKSDFDFGSHMTIISPPNLLSWTDTDSMLDCFCTRVRCEDLCLCLTCCLQSSLSSSNSLGAVDKAKKGRSLFNSRSSDSKLPRGVNKSTNGGCLILKLLWEPPLKAYLIVLKNSFHIC